MLETRSSVGTMISSVRPDQIIQDDDCTFFHVPTDDLGGRTIRIYRMFGLGHRGRYSDDHHIGLMDHGWVHGGDDLVARTSIDPGNLLASRS